MLSDHALLLISISANLLVSTIGRINRDYFMSQLKDEKSYKSQFLWPVDQFLGNGVIWDNSRLLSWL